MLFLLAALASSAHAQSLGWEGRWDGGLIESAATVGHVAVGPEGNVYATGAVRNGEARDLLTVAWSSAGDLLWYRLKDGYGDSDDVPAGLVVDSGTIVVVGTASGGFSDRYMVVVYALDGTEIWARTHWNPAFRWNRARGVAVDWDGRVTVVGEISNGTYKKASLVAFDLGEFLWEKQSEIAPYPGAVGMDPAGYLYVGGQPSDLLNDDDFLTVSFDREGNERWSRTRNGDGDGEDSVRDLMVDPFGLVFVTGVSDSAATDTDLMTVAYDWKTGDELWATTTGGARDEAGLSLAADSAGNIYVGGSTADSDATLALVVSYDPTGEERWASTITEGSGSDTNVYDISVTGSGDVVLAGDHFVSPDARRYLVVQLEGDDGSENWSEIRTPPPTFGERGLAAATGPADSIYVLGDSFSGFLHDWRLAAYDSVGTELWSHKEPLIPSADIPGSVQNFLARGAIATGYEGRVYLTGSTYDGSSIDYMTVAYDASGNLLWEARKSNPNNFPARPIAIAVDSAIGNVYVTGRTLSPGGYDYLTVAYDRNGAELWSRTRQGAAQEDDFPCCIAVNEDGLVIVTGYSEVGVGWGPPDLLTVAYASSGNEVWADEWGPEVGSADFARSLVVGSTGQIYVGGESANWDGEFDFLTVAYDASGGRLWGAVRDAGSLLSDGIDALSPTPDGGVVATGGTDPWGNTNVMTVSYDETGAERWAALFDSPPGLDDYAAAVAVDAAGRTFVAGTSRNPGSTELDYLTIAYDDTGNELWNRRSETWSDDVVGSVSISSNGSIFVTGDSGDSMDLDILTVAYSPGGLALFEHRYESGRDDEGYLAVAGPEGSVFIGGMSYGADRDFLVFQLFDDVTLFSNGFDSGDTGAWSTTSP